MAQDNSAPTERIGTDGSTEFAQSRLIEDSRGLLGVGKNVVAGALHGVTTPYLTVMQAKSLIAEFLARPV